MTNKNDPFCNILIICTAAPADTAVAKELKKRLDQFQIPAYVRKTLSVKQQKLVGILQTEDRLSELLPAEEAVPGTDTDWTENAGWMVVVCTPRLQKSGPCREAVRRFKMLRGQERILLVLAEGEPADSFPKELCFRQKKEILPNGEERTVTEEVEPLAADVREKDAGRKKKLFADAVMRLNALFYGLNYDDLKQRRREQRLRRAAFFSGAAAAVALVIGLTCLYMSMKINAQRKLIERQQAELQEQYAFQKKKYNESMITVAEELLKRGRRLDALYAVRSTLPGDAAQAGDACTPALQKILAAALGVYIRNILVPKEIIPEPEDPDFWGTAGVYGFLRNRIDADDEILCAEKQEDGSVTLVTAKCRIYKYYEEYNFWNNGELIVNDYTTAFLAFVPDRRAVSAAFRNGELFLRFAGTNEVTCYRVNDNSGLKEAGSVTFTESYNIRSYNDGESPLLQRGVKLSSDDEKYIFALGEEKAVVIWEKDRTEPERKLYDIRGSVFSLKKLAGRGGYMLITTYAGYILNEDLEITAEIPDALEYVPAEDAVRFETRRRLEDDTYDCRYLPILSPEELVRQADQLLQDYTPSEETKRRYGIM